MNDQTRPTTNLDSFISRMPKIELHLHLEGTLRPETILRIAKRNGVALPVTDIEGIEQLFAYHHFHEFLNVFMMLVRVLSSGEDFEEAAYDCGCQLADQQVRYAEVMLSPSQYYNRGLNLPEIVQGAAAGFARVERERGTRFALIFDYGRQFGVDAAWKVLEIAKQCQPYGLVGWSIGGDEIHYPPELFTEIFAAARQAGFSTMAHAGEVAGPASIWGAVDLLKCQRLGHGIRCVEDPALMAHLRAKGITLDVSPTSNLRTGAIASLAEHPLRRLFDAGIAITLNSDDPTFFRTTLTDEFRLAVDSFGFDVDGLATLIDNAARATFLPQAERDTLESQCASEIAALRAELGV